MKATLDQRIKHLEQRVKKLEKPAPRAAKKGWVKLAGWANDDTLYDQAMKLGATWRKQS